MTDREPLLAVFYSDRGVVLQTSGGAQLVMPAGDAAALAYSLLRAVEDFGVHQRLVGEVNDAFSGDLD